MMVNSQFCRLSSCFLLPIAVLLTLFPLQTMSLNPPVSPLVKAANLRARKSNAFGFGDVPESVPDAPALKTKSRSLDGEGTALAASVLRGGDDSGGDNARKGKDPETLSKSPAECQEEALKSISDCYKFALGAGFSAISALLFDNRHNLVGGGSILEQIPFMSKVEFLLSIHQIVFGYGLYQAFKIFQIGSKDGSRLDSASFMKLGNILSWVWAMAACSISLEAAAVAYTLESSWLSPIWIRTVSAILFLLSVPICRGFHNEISLRNHKRHPAQTEYAEGRKSGFNAALYMLFTVSALALSGGIFFVESILKVIEAGDMTSKLGTLLSGLMDTAENVTVTVLLATLYQRIIKATVAASTPEEQHNSTASSTSFVGYFEAQVKFYSRIGKFFFWQMVFTILPYVVIIVKTILPYVGLGELVQYLNF